MGKKKRLRKLTVFGSVEGYREQAFLDFLREVYQPENNNIAFYPENANGGGADSIVTPALNKSDRDKSFAWLDEDFEPTESPLSQEIRTRLARCWCIADSKITEFMSCAIGKLQETFNKAKKKPILIVSQPVCCESLILGVLDCPLPYAAYDSSQRAKQITGLKNKLDELMGGSKSTAEQTAFYRSKITKEILEAKRKIIPELELLISMITN